MLGVLMRKPGRDGRNGGHVRQRTLGRGLLAAACALLSVTFALLPGGASNAEDKVTFTVALQNEADSFNPFLGVEAPSFEMWALTYDYLVGYSMKDMSPEPALASSWETSADGLTWTFTVRGGVKWSDGEPMTAQDVVFTYDRILDGGPEKASWGSYLKSVDSVTAPDDTTVVLSLKEPNAVLPLLPIPIVPEHIWSKISEKQVTLSVRRRNGRRLDVPF
jgi:peptide/nickel transport system substrate-binding protein